MPDGGAQYADSTLLAWRLAAREAGAGGAAEIEPGHLLLGLCKLCDVRGRDVADHEAVRAELDADVGMLRSSLAGLGIEPAPFRRALRERLRRPGAGDDALHRSPESRRAFRRAERLAEEALDHRLRPVHLLTALLELDELARAALFGDLEASTQATQLATAADAPGGPTPFLDRFGRDLTELARDGGLEPLIGRREVLRSLAQTLIRQRKRSAILIGEAGVGKTGIVEGLAVRLAGADAPPELAGARIVDLQMSALTAGTRYRGEFEERMQRVIEEAGGDDRIILFIDEIHTLLGAGGEGAADAANIVKPALARGDLRIIGATTIAEYRRHIERDPALERRFAPIWVDEPTRDEAVAILTGLRPRFERHHGVAVSDEAIEAAVELSVRHLTDQRLPDKAIDVIDEALAVARLGSLAADRRDPPPTAIGRPEIAAVIAGRCRIPIERLSRDEVQRLLEIEETLRARVIGQPEAVSAVSDAIRTARAGLNDPRRPVAVLLFAGPTGTGKTELAKALAEALFDDEEHLVRIDMSEYKERHSISRLIGPPPGYLGFDVQAGELTDPVRSNPYTVVLFDEVEKAHPEVLDLCLQIFDEGRLTDSRGRVASFREAVIILTSNLGPAPQPAARGPRLGFAPAITDAPPLPDARAPLEAAIAAALRPELVNRIQRIVAFQPLDRSACRLIVDKIVADVRERLAPRRVQIELTDAAYALVIEHGFDERFGARELERTVTRLLVEPLATDLLTGRIRDGARVRADARDGRLVFADVSAEPRVEPSTRPA